MLCILLPGQGWLCLHLVSLITTVYGLHAFLSKGGPDTIASAFLIVDRSSNLVKLPLPPFGLQFVIFHCLLFALSLAPWLF
ncbi:hypothetical protein PSV09DRAFT_2002287 [Bipolaris maydis]|uniref:uncharacterized protein n=1 Tax=Cochliobolus heterostrophus TaxID=5016 RepID=UPI0024D2DE3A|nr:hypothetical protein J3E74DRAFT_37162 [Bipolaris maydis]KAJ6214627.1 hypothetical protein PSV09DRAFT_2002287 [Bipolaris maydis]KAJ6275789.1 hypothetical protein PSV08DRAFT_2181 [Bipolaris maydis]KAJ6286939.1 hypothetical protein J3E71DRAFT_2030 [Bipolaris maydis]